MNTREGRPLRQDSIAVHAGEGAVIETVHPLSPPIYQSSVFLFDDLRTAGDVTSGTLPGYSYGRIGQPNADMFSRAVADLEGAEAGATAA
ncbi:Cys/Met metabolism, pyridoxal phosphate-dependent enzyme, partial [mine drainage metagenome]